MLKAREEQERATDTETLLKQLSKDYQLIKDELQVLKNDYVIIREDNRLLREDNDVLKKDNFDIKKDNADIREELQVLKEKGMTYSGNKNCFNNTYHIQVVKYGTESYPDDIRALTDAIKGVNKAIPSLVKLRHFDPRHPENQTIHIPNKKQNRIKIYDGIRWITEDKKLTIEDKLQEFTNFMDSDEGQEIYNSCSLMIKEKLDRLKNFCDKVYSGDKLNREESRELKRITGDIENIILDHQGKAPK
tara:strand:- start:404 stop:1144 length:741 start_codon:yes stop_codon:yes gene_type:complete